MKTLFGIPSSQTGGPSSKACSADCYSSLLVHVLGVVSGGLSSRVPVSCVELLTMAVWPGCFNGLKATEILNMFPLKGEGIYKLCRPNTVVGILYCILCNYHFMFEVAIIY